MPGTGGSAQDRRRTRRAAQRRTSSAKPKTIHLADEHLDEIRALVASFAAAEIEPSPDEKRPEDLALEQLDAYERTLSPRDIATMYVKIRPDLSGFTEEIRAVVDHALKDARRSLAAAAGDVAWGPEDGFVDLLCDVNEALMDAPASSYYLEDCEVGCYVSSPYAIDVGVKLDKVLICLGDDYWVAPIKIDGDGEPILSERADWTPVESGWVETNVSGDDEMSSAARLRFALRDLVLTADGAVAPEIPEAHQPGERIPVRGAPPEIVENAPAAKDGEIPWTATFVPEGDLTEDGRAFAPGAIILPPEKGSRELPLTLMAMIETSAEGGHDGAKVAGRIDQIWRDGDLVRASGVFSQEEYGQQIARMVESRELRGLSVDIAPLEWERTAASDWFDADGAWIAQRDENGDWVPVAERSLEEAVELLFSDDLITVITKAVIGMATVCPFPAFGKASIALAASGGLLTYTTEVAFDSVGGKALTASAALPWERGTFDADAGEREGADHAHAWGTIESGFLYCDADDCDARVAVTNEEAAAFIWQPEEGLTASAAGLAPLKPPAEWFADPELDELTPLTITDDGRVFGHAWGWGTCHIAFDGCVTPPYSQTDYKYFELGELECADGERVPVGKVTIDAPHAGQRLSRADAVRHYDHTGTVAAHVCFGEDEHGGWFAGAIAPDLSETKLRLLRGATLSGDWRGVDGNLELVALLAVNVPGFPVPRARALVAAGAGGEEEVLSLTAAGIVLDDPLSAEEAEEIRSLAAAAVEAE